MIEGDLRTVRVQPVAPPPEMPSAPQPAPLQAAASPVAMAPEPKPELPNPVAAEEHFAAAPREFQTVQAAMPIVAPRAISEMLEPPAPPPHAAIEPQLPPDHPLEPGTRPAGRPASPSERIAASESAISEIPAGPPGPVSTSNFIAAARRAAQAAAAAPLNDKTARGGPPRPCRRQGQATVDDHLEDPLVAGRRKRGRHRARHVQDGDDAARQRQPATDARDGEFERAGAFGAIPRGRRRPAGNAGCGDTFDDLADSDRPAILQ